MDHADCNKATRTRDRTQAERERESGDRETVRDLVYKFSIKSNAARVTSMDSAPMQAMRRTSVRMHLEVLDTHATRPSFLEVLTCGGSNRADTHHNNGLRVCVHCW
jgi:hypothetical protein